MINIHNCSIKLSLYAIFLVFSLHAMENDENVQNINRIELSGAARFIGLKIIEKNKKDLAASFIQIPKSPYTDTNKFVFMNSNENFNAIVRLKMYGRLTAAKITQAGNLFFGTVNGLIGFYIANTNECKMFATSIHSRIVALQNGIIINNSDKKNSPCKALAALNKDGILLCIQNDNNFRELNLLKDVPESFSEDSGVSDLLKAATSSAQGVFDISDHLKTAVREIVAADIQPYSICPEAAPFVAYIIRYIIPNLSLAVHSKDVYVYNPILKKNITFRQKAKISDICFLPNYILCTASNDKTIGLFDVFKSEKLYTISIPGQSIICPTSNLHKSQRESEIKIISCESSPCGKYIATINDSCCLNVWDISTGTHKYNKRLGDISCSCQAVASKIAFSPDSNSLYVFSNDSQKIYNIKNSVKNFEISDEGHKNAIRMFINHRGKKESSILYTLRNRELGLNKKIRKGYV